MEEGSLKHRAFGVVCMILLIAATVVATVRITFDQCLIYAPSEENVLFGAEDDKGNSYVYFESTANAGIYKLSDTNKLMGSVIDNDGRPWDGGKILGLLVSSHTVYLPVRTLMGVKVYSWDDEFEKKTERLIPFPVDVKVAGISVKGDTLNMVVIENDGANAVVYSAARETEPVSIYNEEAPEGTRFLDAYYVNGRLERLLSDGTRTAGFSSAAQQRTVLPDNVGFMGITLGFSTVVRNVLIMAAVIFMIVFFFRSVVFKRDYAWLKVYGFMFIVSCCLTAAVFLISDTTSESKIDERMRSSEYILGVYAKGLNAYDGSLGTQKYNDAYTEVSRITDAYGTISDIAVVSINNSRAMVAVSTRLPFGDWLSGSWGDTVDELIVKSHSRDNAQWGVTTRAGHDYMVVVMPVNDDAASRCFLAGLVGIEDIEAENRADLIVFFLYMAIIWGVALLMIMYVNFARARELRAVAKTLARVSNGEQTEVVRPRHGSKDFELMWNAASELSKGMGRNNYLKSQTLASLSRFAPQNIDILLSKDSLADVRLGDRGSVCGTVALIEIGRPFVKNRDEIMDQMNQNIETICRFKNEYSGVLISDSATLCSTRMLFARDDDKAISFGVRTSEALRKSTQATWKKSMILLHKTDYEYGITGSADQNFACISSTQLDALSEFVPKLGDLGLRLVATEEVVSNRSGDCSMRYIGYIVLPDNGGEVRLYEILDAATAEERDRKKETSAIFKKALDLYYASDFYLARNLFTEAVKECPEDLVARWYLFKCEGMLDGGRIEQFSYGLLSE